MMRIFILFSNALIEKVNMQMQHEKVKTQITTELPPAKGREFYVHRTGLLQLNYSSGVFSGPGDDDLDSCSS
jgi:hypothetical protein